MIVVGGPNGAGKSTFVNRFLTEREIPYLGADKIAADIRPDDPESVAFEAGREFIRQIDLTIANAQSFIVESTLSGRSLSRTVLKAKEAGYEVEMHFVFVDSEDVSVARVARRVMRGGHHVPDHDVRRRFSRALRNIWNRYRPLSDSWFLHYNAEIGHVEVARSILNDDHVFHQDLLDSFFELAGIERNDC